MNTAIAQRAESAVSMGFQDLASFEFMQRTAKMFSASSMVPAAYQEMTTKGFGQRATTEHNPAALANCVIALDMSQRMNANPLMIMQNLHVIEGRPSWSSQFIIAAINNSGKFSPLRFDLEWLDEIDATFSTYEWIDNRKIEQKHKVRIKNARCVAWATELATGQRLESAPVTMEMAVAEGWYGKNGSKWKSMPDLMMRYRSAAFFGRIYAPELLMGLPTAEETHDVFTVDEAGAVSQTRQAVPRSAGTVNTETGEIEPVTYPQEKFDANLSGWADMIAAGRKTADTLIAFVESRPGTAPFTDAQKAALRELGKQPGKPDESKADETPNKAPKAKGKPEDAPAQPGQPVTDVQPKGEAPKFTFAQVADRLNKAQDLDALYIAGDLIGEVVDPEHRTELTELFESRKFVVESA